MISVFDNHPPICPRVLFYNSHRVKSSLLSLELSFRSLLQGDDSTLRDNSKLRVSIIKNSLVLVY